ncbi:MAG: PspA/IM30 family protein [Phycisphaerae bacterium]|nr:PspA/IM30 family protein [Phycisphaerae bacterium]
MELFDRIQRIAKANINWFLDKVESPEQELESKIREMEEIIQQGRGSVAIYGANYKRLERQRDELLGKQQTLIVQAEQLLKAGDEPGARKALTEKVKLTERMTQIEPGIEKGRATYGQLRDNLIKLQDQLKTAKLRLQELKSRKQTAEAYKAFDEKLSGATTLSGDMAGIDDLENDVIMAETEAEVMREMRTDSLSDLDLVENSRDLQVDSELLAMKDKMEKEK